MKVLKITHKGIKYEFRLLERSHRIEVFKAGDQTYIIKSGSGFFSCNCPGARYHKKCWHVTIIGALKAQPTINEPWAECAEQAGEFMAGKETKL